ncbi:hypothetical protein NMY22_g690 [Coprinellus aureogranulatus]|nr:hypothetical protein NMY22_g690 [Coprinellus aureogranulatus]
MIVSLLSVLGFVASTVAQSTPIVVCVAGQCVQGFSNTTIGAKLSASGSSTELHLLPGQYTSTTNPQLLHDLLSSSSANSQLICRVPLPRLPLLQPPLTETYLVPGLIKNTYGKALAMALFETSVGSLLALRKLLNGQADGSKGDYFKQVRSGEIPLVIEAHSADIIAKLLILKKQIRVGTRKEIKLTITGASEADTTKSNGWEYPAQAQITQIKNRYSLHKVLSLQPLRKVVEWEYHIPMELYEDFFLVALKVTAPVISSSLSKKVAAALVTRLSSLSALSRRTSSQSSRSMTKQVNYKRQVFFGQLRYTFLLHVPATPNPGIFSPTQIALAVIEECHKPIRHQLKTRYIRLFEDAGH